jgi:hypothetical protein
MPLSFLIFDAAAHLYQNVPKYKPPRREVGASVLDSPFGWGPPMTTRSEHYSDFNAHQLELLGTAAIVLLIFAWTFV